MSVRRPGQAGKSLRVVPAWNKTWNSYIYFLTPRITMVRSLLVLAFLAAAAQAVPDGFSIHEFVGTKQEPELYPTALSAAANGDLYISSDRNGSLGHTPGLGRILIARDTKGTGVADTMIEFTKVDSPRGGHILNGSFYLVHPPFLSVYRDKDGDGKADEEIVLVEGLGGGIEHPRGADHTTNSCRMGIDGWLYIAVGDFGAGLLKDLDGAKGRDGKRVTLYGGGVLRVRPDGSELEIYAEMTRNIVDIAISPAMDIFSRDNTNDGKGWNTRFHHFTSLANPGYPRLYKNFIDELALPLADYGGGSGTGALYLSEPGFPGNYGESLFTCDWTTGTLHRHPIKPFEATFVAQQEVFEKAPHAIDLEVDANSKLYFADWRDGRFSYNGPGKQVGLIQQILPVGTTPNKYVDVTKAAAADLPGLLRSKSAVQRLETSRRLIENDHADQAPAVLAVATDTHEALYSRIAALFTYKQMLGAKANEALVGLVKDTAVREYALRALADRASQLDGVPTQPFIDALKDADPRVRLQALVGLQRLGAKDTSAAIIAAAATWPTDESKLEEGAHYRLTHTAINALIKLGDEKAALEAASDPAKRYIAFRVLQALHTDASVDGVIALTQKGDEATRVGAVGALARLYHVEKPWNYKDWWSTRPDDRGPYFDPVEWSATPRIHEAIEAAYPKLPGNQRIASLEILSKNRIAISALKLAGIDPLRLAMASNNLRPSDVLLLTDAAVQAKRPWSEKVDCFKALHVIDTAQGDNGDPYFPNRLKILGVWSKDASASSEALQFVNEFVYDSARFKQVGKLRTLADGADDATSTILWKALFNVLNSPLSKPDQKKQVQALVNKNPRDLGFFYAITDLGLTGFDKQLEAGMKGDNALQNNAAKAALEEGKKVLARKGKKIAQLDLADVTAVALKGHGKVKQGEQLFTKQGCVACHAISLTAEQKGPYLGSVGVKFPREYLVESVLYPSKVVAQGFQTFQFDMKDGSVQMGFVTAEADGEIALRNIAGQAFKIKRADVKEEKHLPQSMMPEGLASGLTVEEFTSLIEYLSTLKAVGG